MGRFLKRWAWALKKSRRIQSPRSRLVYRRRSRQEGVRAVVPELADQARADPLLGGRLVAAGHERDDPVGVDEVRVEDRAVGRLVGVLLGPAVAEHAHEGDVDVLLELGLAQRRGDDTLGLELLEQPVHGDRVEPGLDRELLEERLGRDRDPGTEGGALLIVVTLGGGLVLDLGAGARLVHGAQAGLDRGELGGGEGPVLEGGEEVRQALGDLDARGRLREAVVPGDQGVPAGRDPGLVDDRLDVLGADLIRVEHESLVPALEGVEERAEGRSGVA